MVVIDRSGSMSMSDGAGRSKIETARDAVSLFVQLIRAGTGNRLGLVSFSTSASSPVDANLSPATAGSKTVLVGNAPYSTGLVGGLNPNGMTSIGDGLQAARNQLAAGGTNPRAILLMTDGLQNTAPMIADIDASLAGITVHAVGFGTESSLDGALLTSLTNAHGGQYQRAGNGLTLEKFFSSAFGNIFETGILFDPDFHLAADQPGEPIPFSICGEEALTVVIGWDNPDARLLLEVTTPNGVVIFGSTPSVEEDAGKTWHFLRIPLPLAGERDGPWSVRAIRPGGGGEFPPPAPATTYFINVIPSGGPKLTRMDDPKRYYTGDPINPLVILRYEDGGWPKTSTLRLNISRPDASIGTLLSRNGLGAADAINADGLDARQATLQAIERSTGRPVVRYIESSFNLSDESDATDGVFEPSGTFGTPLPGLFNVEGNYTFHAKASYGESCLGMRELIWSTHVEIGIDPGQTTVTSTPLGTGSGGETCQRLTFTPRDVFGNLLGPGRLDAFTAQGTTNTTLNGPVSDLGNGQYQVDACTNPESLEPPSIDLTQPGRPGVTISEPRKLFIYSVKFVCGIQLADCHCPPVQPGRYASEINILNPSENPVPMLIRPIPLVLAGAASGRDPKANGPGNKSVSKLPAHGATMIDCCRALELLLGAEPNGATALTIGLFEVISTSELIVTAVYTASHGDSAPAIDVQQIAAKPFKV
jgi:von Willebrand factor type A domain